MFDFKSLWICLMLVSCIPTVSATKNDYYTQEPVVKKISASQYAINLETLFNLGDRDSKIDAKQIALKILMEEASSLIGVYVENEIHLTNGQITYDESKLFTASVMKVKINNEEYFYKNDRLILRLNITAVIDEKVLRSNIKEFQSRNKEKEEIIALSKKNQELMDDVVKISNELQLKPDKDIEYLLQKRKILLEQVNKNNNIIQKSFEKGLLFDMYKLERSDLELKKLELIEKTNPHWNDLYDDLLD